MDPTLISACKSKLKQTFRQTVFPLPAYIHDMAAILHDEYSIEVIRLACDELHAEGLIKGIPDPDGHIFIIEDIC